MSNGELPWLPWYPARFEASTRGWTFMQRAVYRALLDLQWQAQICCISAKQSDLSRMLEIDSRAFAKCWKVIGPKFAKVEGGLQNRRLEEHRLAALEAHKKRVVAGRAGGLSRQALLKQSLVDNPSNAKAMPQAMLKHLTSKNKTLPPYPPSRARAANGRGAAARARGGEPGAIREDDPEVRRKRKEAETLAAQLAKPREDDDPMPF